MFNFILLASCSILLLAPQLLPFEGFASYHDVLAAYLLALLISPWVSGHFE